MIQWKLTAVADVENPVVHDLFLKNGSFVLIGDTPETFKEAVAQNIKQRLLFFKGEWFLDRNEGVPWFEDILVLNVDLGLVRTIFKQVITGTDGVASVQDMTLALDRAARALSVSFIAILTDGSKLVSGEVPGPFVVTL